ncbi:hypothetical protein BJX64DRAFT_287549 [Aspergillus heterothallicus]
MTEKFFFHDWVGKMIKLTTTNPPSEWKLVTKLSDKSSQQSAEDYNENCSASGTAYGSFVCQNTNDSSDMAIMKIIMQVPYRGSEYAIHAERARQACERVSGPDYTTIYVFKLLRDNNCNAAPRIRAHEGILQDDSMLVPGGFLHYVLMDKAGGVQLTEELFWSYDLDERNRIREAYKEAWREWTRCGVSGGAYISHLFWDSNAGKM